MSKKEKIAVIIPAWKEEVTIKKVIQDFQEQLPSAKFIFNNDDYTLRTEFDLNIRFAETNDIISSSFASINPALGFEFGYTDIVFLRAGLGNFQNELQIDNSDNLTFQPNFGVGFKYNGIEIDYAFTDIGDQSAALYSNVFSLKLDFSIFR